jgi:hypothetical protein
MKSINKVTACLPGSDHSKAPATQQKLKLMSSAVLLGLFIMATHSAISSAAVNSTIGGEVERIIVNDPGDTWSGGIMVVGGVNVIIPRNMVIDLPANRLTLQQFFVNAPSACAAIDVNNDTIPDQTGLAKADSCNGSFTGAAATILANRSINGDIIAGEIMLEKSTELVSGIVSYINYDEGYFRVDGIPGDPATGAMVRVNDPEGRHTHQTGASCAGSGPNCSADTRYGVDPDNYTFTASTGYPMCIPSTTARPLLGTYNFDVNGDGVIDPGVTETGLKAQALAEGTDDALCPQSNRPGVGIVVGDSRLFAPVKIGDHVNADGNFETIGGVTFLSAHTVGVSVGLTTDETAFQPDYMIFDEVGWDVPGYQNQRVRDLLIGFSTLGAPEVDIFGLYYDPANNAVEELVFATTAGCDAATSAGTCTTQGIVGNTGIFKIVHDVDFVVPLPIDARQSPCAHLNAAYAQPGGIPDKDGNPITVDPKGRCSTDPINIGNLAEEFEVLTPATRDIIGRSRHQHALDDSVVTLDFHAVPSQNGQYLNPTGIGHPEFVEIDLNGLQTPLIFVGEQWNMDRRLGPGGGCDGEALCDSGGGVDGVDVKPIGHASMRLDPFPYSDLDPGTQAGAPGVPVVSPHTTKRGRTLSYWPLTGQEMPWPLAEPGPQGITATLHAGLMCTLLSGIDTDGDGVDDAIDNCTLVANGPTIPDAGGNIQRDTDGDGYGNVCDADLDGSKAVNLVDFGLFRTAFGQSGSFDFDADFDGSGAVNLIDFGIFRALFGGEPGPSGLNP